MTEQKLKELLPRKIVEVLMDDDFEIVELNGSMACEIADLLTPVILAFTDAYYKEKYVRYVKLADDQNLPNIPSYDSKGNRIRLPSQWVEAQQEMLKVVDGKAWRKVKIKDG